MDQDIKVPSATSQTSNILLQYGSHYALFCLVEILLFFRSPAGFVIGDVTGALLTPFLFSSTFFFGFGSWFGTYEGPFVGLLVPSIWDGDTLAYGPDAPPFSVCEAILALETGHMWASPTELRLWESPTDVLWALPTEVVFWKCQGGYLPPWVSLKCEVPGGLPHQRVCGTVPRSYPGNELFYLVPGLGDEGCVHHSEFTDCSLRLSFVITELTVMLKQVSLFDSCNISPCPILVRGVCVLCFGFFLASLGLNCFSDCSLSVAFSNKYFGHSWSEAVWGPEQLEQCGEFCLLQSL